MKRLVPYTNFGKTKLVPHITYTNKKRDANPKDTWECELWVESNVDFYGLTNKTTLIVERNDFLIAKETQDSVVSRLKERKKELETKIKNHTFSVKEARKKFNKEHNYLLNEREKVEEELARHGDL